MLHTALEAFANGMIFFGPILVGYLFDITKEKLTGQPASWRTEVTR